MNKSAFGTPPGSSSEKTKPSAGSQATALDERTSEKGAASGLDIDTPKGKETQLQEQEAYEIFHEMHPEARVLPTPKTQPALVDGVIETAAGIVGTVETKCRRMTMEKLVGDYDGEWLITHDKIDKNRRASAAHLGVPFYGFLYLVSDSRLLIWKISDEEGNWMFDFDTRKTFTQANVNSKSSQSARRLNAFLPVDFIVEDSEGQNMGALLW